jgi:hypothetical protein
MKDEIKYDWMQTYSGKRFYPYHPKEEDICLIDIAHSLAYTGRFSGHCKTFYSVAQHSVLMSYMCGIQGLMHDSAEAYVTDIPRPVKIGIPIAKEIEDNILKVIFKKYNIPFPLTKEVKDLDSRFCVTEGEQLLIGGVTNWDMAKYYKPLDIVIEPWEFKKSRFKFIRRFWELYNVDY